MEHKSIILNRHDFVSEEKWIEICNIFNTPNYREPIEIPVGTFKKESVAKSKVRLMWGITYEAPETQETHPYAGMYFDKTVKVFDHEPSLEELEEVMLKYPDEILEINRWMKINKED